MALAWIGVFAWASTPTTTTTRRYRQQHQRARRRRQRWIKISFTKIHKNKLTKPKRQWTQVTHARHELRQSGEARLTTHHSTHTHTLMQICSKFYGQACNASKPDVLNSNYGNRICASSHLFIIMLHLHLFNKADREGGGTKGCLPA